MNRLPGLKIRTATHADLAQVNQVLVGTWHDTYDELIGSELPEGDFLFLVSARRRILKKGSKFLLTSLPYIS